MATRAQQAEEAESTLPRGSRNDAEAGISACAGQIGLCTDPMLPPARGELPQPSA